MSSLDDFAHLRIPLENILSATNNFDDENLVGGDVSEKFYEGQLLWSGESIDILAGRFNKEWFDGDQQFWLEVSMLSSLKHKNLVSLVGFCDENDEKVIVFKAGMRGSLSHSLRDPMLLTWVRRLEICVGIAQALSYIHYDESRDFSVIHRNINSYSILLNDDWEPKLGGFKRSMKIKASERHNSFYTDEVWGMDGYTDPIYIKTKSADHKLDMYSFGIVMFELLCGRKAVIDDDQDNKYLASVAVAHYREKKLNEIIDWELWNQMDSQSFNVFAEIAYDCLNEERSQRPNIDEVVRRLEKALEIQLEHHNAIMSSRSQEFAHFRVPLENILSATNNFDQQNVITERGYDKRYKGQLLWSGELIDITARRLNKEWDERDQQLWMEVSLLSSLKHKNLFSFVGFCDENDEKIIITRRETRGSLGSYLSNTMMLTWVRRLEISVGIAQALSYIHYDESRDFSIIHRQIHSARVVLNDDWEPKLCDFECSMKIKGSERQNSFYTYKVWSTDGYTDPTYIETKSVNHKSDMYSFGIVIFELLCGRSAVIKDDKDNKYLASVAVAHYREKNLDEIIDSELWKQMDLYSFNMFAEIAYECLDEERSRRPNIDEIVPRLRKALELAREKRLIHSPPKNLARLRIPIEDLLSATRGYLSWCGEENVGEKGRFGKIYKGQLSWCGELINITIRRLINNEWEEKEQQFWTEISMLSSLKHKNLVSIVGFCIEVGAETIIYKDVSRGRLKDYINDSMLLTWVKRLEVSVGVAHALRYIHYDEPHDFSVIHRNINSEAVRLNNDWEPKLSEFQHSMKIKASERHHPFHTDSVWPTKGHTDQTYLETGSVNHKSDIYSFGMVLFELICESVLDKHLAPAAIFHYKKKILDEIIDPVLRKQMHPRSLNIFAETAYECLSEEQSQCPTMDQIVTRLESALELQMERQNAEKNLEHLRIGLNDLNEATNSFDDTYCIGSGGFGKVYKTVLEHFDSSNSSLIEGMEKWDMPRKRSTVAIKRIHSQEGEQGFIAEIETLTSFKHENIISLLGFCYEGNGAMILVYEHASKGSLENYLGSGDKMTNLAWLQRVNISLDIAHGLNYIHNNTDHGKQKMIHRDITSENILLGHNWKAKIADFGLFKFHPANQAASTIYTDMIAGTYVYLDPAYQKDGRLNKKSDIYSFGVVLLEILTGRLAYDSVYTKVNEKGIAPIARYHFKKGTIMEIVDHKIKEETDEHVFCKGPDKESLDIFLEIALRCVAETQEQRPTIEVVIKELKKALKFQENHKDNLKLSLEAVKLATHDFSQDNIIGHGDFGTFYRGVVTHAHGHNIIAAKRLNRKCVAEDAEFMAELEILMEYKHENVIVLVGYCNEEDEKVIIYEYASRGSLDKYLSDDSLTWVMRLKICIDIAIGLEFLHGTVSSLEILIHRDISSRNILLFDDWKAKITGFGLSLLCPVKNQNVEYVIDNVTGTIGYRDPLYSKRGFLTKESDIFSLGAVLFDILCGKLSSVKLDDECLYLPFLAKNHYYLEKLDKLVFEGIKEQIVPESYITFTRIALQCIHHRRERRPTADEVVRQLKKALELQLKPENYDNSIVEGTSSFIHKKFQHLKIELQAIKSATNEFDDSHCIGRGGFGKVYKVELVHPKGQSVVALKRLDRAFGQGNPEFWKEIIMLSQYRHDNIVSLLGFCDDCGEKILVYEYASRRSLDLYLNEKDLRWVQRLKICIGAARGLAHLHNPGQTHQRVLHRDIKSSNILLDENWNAKIADFGLSKFGPANQQFTFLVSNGVGTIGYCDPLYVQTGLLTKESDVYSFGVVLFEMLCGRLCISNKHDQRKPLTALVHKCYEERTIADIVYGNIKDEINPDSLKTFTAIAYQCLNRDQEQRPSMTEVVKALESALICQVSNEPPTSILSRKKKRIS